MSGCVHISSLIIQVRPERAAEVREAIERQGGEIAASDPCGKLIVVIETPDEAGVSGFADRLAVMDGVLSANLVYHLVDDPEAPGKTSETPGEIPCPARP
jgi:nitrate reductase NapD